MSSISTISGEYSSSSSECETAEFAYEDDLKLKASLDRFGTSWNDIDWETIQTKIFKNKFSIYRLIHRCMYLEHIGNENWDVSTISKMGEVARKNFKRSFVVSEFPGMSVARCKTIHIGLQFRTVAEKLGKKMKRELENEKLSKKRRT